MTGVYIIAEAGVNHNGIRELAFELIDVAAKSGADAVKFQTFNAERLAAVSAPKAAYQIERTAGDDSQLAMLKRLELPLEWHRPLQEYAESRGITFISTAFDVESLNFLETLNLPFYKIPSGEITNGLLLWRFANTRRKLVVSTGMATIGEVEAALAVIAHARTHEHMPTSLEDVWANWNAACIKEFGNDISLLHCTSQYPTDNEEVNLRAMDTLRSAFGLAVGYSDHTEGCLVSFAAVARGASIIEKHFTLSRDLDGPDHAASLEPAELEQLVLGIRRIEQTLGDELKAPQPSEWNSRRAGRQVLIASRRIEIGEVLCEANVSSARAGAGLTGMNYWDTIGRESKKSYEPGDPI